MQAKTGELSAFALISQGKTVKKTKQSEVTEDPDDDGVEVDDDDNDNDIDEDEESPFRDPPEGCVRLRPSQFHGIPATVFVEYPPELLIRRIDHSVIEPLGQRKLGYKSHWERICIKNAHCRAGFQKSEKYWTSLWSKHQNADQMRELNCLQKINHFPASWCIGRKDRLTRTLNTMKRIHGANGNLFDIHPETYILPGERESLGRLIKSEIGASLSGTHRTKSFNSTNAAMSATGGMWIVKPCAASCGQGIKVMTGQRAMALPKKKKAVVQRYLARPYLIDGRKFDLRIYVLVSGVDPLRVYIHDEGLTRISTAKYTLKNLTNNFAHLTNYSINKNAPNFKAAAFSANPSEANPTDGCDPAVGSAQDPEMEGFKWSLAAFRRWLAQQEGREVMEQTFDRIFDLCLKSVIAAEGEITPHLHSSAQYRTNCFELFGCDVILDSDLRPHLLEVNVSPSLMGSSPLDKKIKGMVIADILHIVGLYPHDPALLKRYDTNNSSSSTASTAVSTSSKGSSSKTAGTAGEGNPFTFNSLSKMMNAQDRYRRSPSVDSIDIAALGDTEASWLLLLTAEDELLRAKSSKFHCVHPTVANAVYYTGLYRSVRFSDHLLAHWVVHGGSRGKCGKHIPHKFRPVHAVARGSPEKAASSPAGRTEYTAVSSSASRARAKSAGRTTSATQRASTYNPNMSPSSEKLRGGGGAVASYYHSEHDLVGHASRRSLHEQQQQQQDGGADSAVESRSRARGKSEPRSARAASPSADATKRELKKAFPASPASAKPHLPTTPSSVRTRLESGINQAAFYAAGIADMSLSPSEDRKKGVARQQASEFDDDIAGSESAEVTPSPSARQQRNTTGVLRQARAVSSNTSLLPFGGDGTVSGKFRTSHAPTESGNARSSGRSSRPTSAAATRQGSPAINSNPASSSNSVAPEDDDAPHRGRVIRPSTSSKALASSGSAHKLQMDRSLGGIEKAKNPNSTASPSASATAHSSNTGYAADLSGQRASLVSSTRSAEGQRSVSGGAPGTTTSSAAAATHSSGSAGGALTDEAVVEVIDKVQSFRPPRGPVSPKNGVPLSLSPSPSLSRPMLSEFALFNDQIRARATASREDSRAYLQNSANHSLDTSSPLKQRRVSLTKSSGGASGAVASGASSGGKYTEGVIHSAIHSTSAGSVRSQSKQELLEQVHKTLLAPVSGGSAGSPTYQSGRGSPADMAALQMQPQVAAHPSFSQPISPTSSIMQQQSQAFGSSNTAVVKPLASGKIIQYGSPSAHPGNRYAK